MTIEVLPSRALLGVFRDERLAAPSNYWRPLGGFDSNFFFSTLPEIIFEQIETERKVAPFVLPTNTGRPTYKRLGSTAKSFRPAYIKPKDPVTPWEQTSRRSGDLFTDTPNTPQQNYDLEVADILRHHREIIDRRWEWLAAQAMIYGQVTIEYEDGPSVLVDFGRAATNTVVKTTDLWSPTYDILKDIEEYCDIMRDASFGGIPNRLTMGTEVWRQVRKNEGLLELMDLTMRGSNVDIERGLVQRQSREENVFFVGRIGAGRGTPLELWVYADFYQDNAGTQVPFMNSRDIVLTAPNVGGVSAFGAIMDIEAGIRSQAVFNKMWLEKDPSAAFIMSQSAPLLIPVNPNRTLRARVVEEDSNS